MIVERSSKRKLMRLVDLVNFVSRDYAEEKPYEDEKQESFQRPVEEGRREREGSRVGKEDFWIAREENVSWNVSYRRDRIEKRRNRVFLVFLEGHTDNFTVNTGGDDRWNIRRERETGGALVNSGAITRNLKNNTWLVIEKYL